MASSHQRPKIAFAGLGAMGSGMASHLLTSNFPVTAYDISPPALSRFLTSTSPPSPLATTAPTPRAAATNADILICMVATSAQATPLLFSSDTGAVHGLKKNATIIICSTVSPAYILELHTRLRSMNRSDIHLLDAPVSGGAARAANGTLSIFVSPAQLAQHAPAHAVLTCLSAEKKLYEIPGGLGMGSKAKLIHQVFAGVHIAMASEAMGVAAVAGMETRGVWEAVRGGEGGSWMFENRVLPMMMREGEGKGRYSAVEIIAKDVGIITHTSREYKHPLPLLSAAEQLYLTSISAGLAKEDDCVTVRLYIPAHPTLVADRASSTTPTTKTLPEPISNDVTIETIRDLLIGVHLAVVAEAMSFCDRLGIDADLMYDIVANAAGASNAFVSSFEALRKGGWALKAAPDAEGVRDRLAEAMEKVYPLRYPLHLSSAALQEFDRSLAQ